MTARGIALIYHLITVLVLNRVLRVLRPTAASWGTLVYAWHPLILLEFVSSAHNDGLMILLIGLAVWVDLKDKRRWAITALTLAGLVKITALLILPVYIVVRVLRRSPRWGRTGAEALLLAGGLIGLAYLPFWEGPATVLGYLTAPQLTRLAYGPTAVVGGVVQQLWCRTTVDASSLAQCQAQVQASMRGISLALFALIAGGITGWRSKADTDWRERAFWIMCAYTILATFYFQPWYGGILIILNLLRPRPQRLILVWAATLPLLYGLTPLPGRILLTAALLCLVPAQHIMYTLRQRANGHPHAPADRQQP